MTGNPDEKILILDGAMATELETAGADLRDSLWSAKVLIEAPHLIEQVHYHYLQAGADIITTATYQASVPGFKDRGFEDEAIASLFTKATRLAQSARDRYLREYSERRGNPPRVAASVGPYGAFLADGSEYSGDYDVDEAVLRDFHLERLRHILHSAPDLLIFETIPSLAEAQVLLGLLEELPSVEAWLSFSCRDETHISDGTPFVEAVRLVAASPLIGAVGVNCLPPAWVPSLLKIATVVNHNAFIGISQQRRILGC